MVILVAILLRFVNLEHKIFWQDESAVAMYEAGYSFADLESLYGDERELQPQDIRRLTLITWDRGFADTLTSLADDNPQIAPLYPVLARAWRLAVGDSVGLLRALSALLSVLMVLSLAYLALELTHEPRVAWLAAALAAVSPFHQLYAQEAREYSLWAMLICLSSALLLRALRGRQRADWAVYALSMTAGLYTHLLFGLVLVAHTVYLIGVSGFRRAEEGLSRRDVLGFVGASAIGLLAFAPWLAVMAQHWTRLRQQTDWTAGPYLRLNLAPQWLIDLCHLLVDQPNQVGGSEMTLFRLVAGYGVACLLGYSLVWLIETTPRRTWLFVASLTLVPWAPLALIDLVRGGVLSTIERYLTPTYLGLELALAVVAAHKLCQHGRSARFWSVLLGVLLVWGLLGDMRLTQVQFVRTKGDNDALIAASEVVNPLPHPVLMVNMWRTAPYTLLVLGRLFDDDTQLRLIYDHSPTLVPDRTGSPLYILNPSPLIRQRLAAAGEPVRDVDFADLIQVRP